MALIQHIRNAAGVQIDKKWVGGIRKGWKQVISQVARVKERNEGLDTIEAIDNALRYLALLTQDLFFGKGLYPFMYKWEGKRLPLTKQLKQKAPFNIQAKVSVFLEAAQKELEEGKRRIKFWMAVTNPQTQEYKLDGGKRYKEIVENPQWYTRSEGQAIGKFLNHEATQIASEVAGKADQEISGRLLRALSAFSGKYPGMEIGEEADRDFSIGKVKVTFQDVPTTDLKKMKPEEIDKIRSPLLAKRYVKPLATARSLLRNKKLDYLWYGNFFVKPKGTYGPNPHGTQFGVGGWYDKGKDAIFIEMGPTEGLTILVVHELGHRYYYKYMSMADRLEFSSYFGQVPGVSDYGKTISAEDFAEVFAYYVLNRELTRDQLERFKKFLGRKKQRGANTEGRGGLIMVVRGKARGISKDPETSKKVHDYDEKIEKILEEFEGLQPHHDCPVGGVITVVRGRAKFNVQSTDDKKARDYAIKKFKMSDQSLYDVLPEFDVGYLVLRRRLKQALNIPRVEMPVIRQKDLVGFSKYLQREHEVVPRWKRLTVSKLLPTQSQIWLDKLMHGIIKDGKLKAGDPRLDLTIIVSKEGYILDGHHRWASALITDPSLGIKALYVPLRIKELLPIAREYGKSVGNAPRAEVKGKGTGGLKGPFVEKGKYWASDTYYKMDVTKDRFIHFTTVEAAKSIVKSKKMLLHPPGVRHFGPVGVFAVSLVWGWYVPGTQLTHIKSDKPLVAVVFTTDTVPEGVAHHEEVIWEKDVKLKTVQVVSKGKAIQLLKRVPFQLKDEDAYVLYR